MLTEAADDRRRLAYAKLEGPEENGTWRTVWGDEQGVPVDDAEAKALQVVGAA